MSKTHSIADHWGIGDVFARILAAMEASAISPETATVEDLASVDHFHARGFAATEDLADALPIKPGDRLVDIGCGIDGPSRYHAKRFGCHVNGIDITEPFIEAANKLTSLVGLEGQVEIELGDGQSLPYSNDAFDGGYTQHVTMNIADRGAFFGETFRVLKPGAFFALSEYGLGAKGNPHYLLPWTEDGSGAHLVSPANTVAFLEQAGFTDITVTDTGPKYPAGYRRAMHLASNDELPAFGTHILLGETAPEKTKNAARNIEEGRTRPIHVICLKPA